MSYAGKDSSKELLTREISGRIRAALEIKDWTKIEFWSRKWIQTDPTNPEGFKWLARCSLAQNNLKMAGYGYSRLLDYDSQSAEALKFLQDYPSFAFEEAVQTELIPKATTQLKQQAALELRSPDQKISNVIPEVRRKISVKHFELGNLYEEAGFMNKAAEHYMASYETQASQIAGLAAARTLHTENKSGEAMRFLKAQVENFPSWVDGRMLLGRIYFEVGYRAEAQKQFQLVLKLDPNHKQALQSLRTLIT